MVIGKNEMMHVVIFAGGTLRPGKAFYAAIGGADMFIAADSGAETALKYATVALKSSFFDFSLIDASVRSVLHRRSAFPRVVSQRIHALEKKPRPSCHL